MDRYLRDPRNRENSSLTQMYTSEGVRKLTRQRTESIVSTGLVSTGGEEKRRGQGQSGTTPRARGRFFRV